METARLQLLHDETKTQRHCAPPAPTPPRRAARMPRARWPMKAAKGEQQQQLVVIRDFLLERAAKRRLCRQRESDAKADPWATAAAVREERGGQEVVQNALQQKRGFGGGEEPSIPRLSHQDLFRPTTSSGSARKPLVNNSPS